MMSEYGIYYDFEKTKKKYGLSYKEVAEIVGIEQKKLSIYAKHYHFPVSIYMQCREKLPQIFPEPGMSEEDTEKGVVLCIKKRD